MRPAGRIRLAYRYRLSTEPGAIQCQALDMPIESKNVENIRSKLKRLVSRGILTETEPGLFTQPRP